MSTDDPFAFIADNSERKAPTKKPHWKDKLFSKDKRNKGSSDQQIEAFLGPSRSKSVSYGASSAAETPRGLPTPPRLDVGHRWPSAQEVLNNASPVSNPSSATEQYAPSSLSRPQKLRARKGLKVKFSNQVPEVIGQGGDESEEPTMEISLCRERQRPSEASEPSEPSGNADYLPQLHLDTSFGDPDRPIPRPRPHQRTNTNEGLSAADWKPLLAQSPQNAEFLMALNLGDRGSRVSFRASPESNSFAQRVRAKMQAEEGRALQHGYEDPMSPSNEKPRTEKPPDVAPDSPSSLYETPPISDDDEPPPNPFRSPTSPEARSHGRNQSINPPALPSGLTPGGNAPSLSPTKPSPIPGDPALDGGSPTRPISKDSSDAPRPQQPKFSLRSIANQFGDTAFTDLKGYTAQYANLIQLSAESVKPLMETSLAEWMRAAVWWFMRGKKRLETYARSRPSSSSGRPASRSSLEGAKQAVVDLGKTLWINEQIIPKHPELSRYGSRSIDSLIAVANTTGDKQLSDLLSLHQSVMNHLRSLAMSIKRNNIITTISSEDDTAIRVDTSVWLRYPVFAPDVSAVLSGSASRSMLIDKSGKSPDLVNMMPLGDTNQNFSYGSMFVEVYVSSSEDDDQQQFSIPCALSIVRDRADWYVFAAITSQSELVNVMIQSDRKKGPTWDSVEWQVRSHSMRVKLPRGFELDVIFQEHDFKNIWNIVQYTRKTEASLQQEAGESMIFESTMKVFQYMDPGTPKAFPPEPVERCRLRLFERSKTITEGTGTRSMHQGYRITVLTSPKVKTLSSVCHIVGYDTPVVFGLLRGENGAPALLLKIKEEGRTRSMLMTFEEDHERTTMHSLLMGMLAREDEAKTPDIPIRAYSIEQPADRNSGQPGKVHLQFPAGNVSVIDLENVFVDHGYGPTVLSENLRAFVATEWGSVTDRINLGPGELKLGLDINNRTGLSLYRPGQQDLTVSVAENLVLADMPDSLTGFLQIAKVKPMIRRFDFATVKDLHAFEAAVTGFKVLFDSVASSFTISRRRSVVPITKKWEANLARIQIVQHEKVVQLVAFLNDFHHGKCMNFVLKGTDTFANYGRAGKFGVRIVDAKFALPKTENDPASDFVCLDMPEYPIEHDDISIAFDSESDRTNFHAAVPGTVREPSRMGSLRR